MWKCSNCDKEQQAPEIVVRRRGKPVAHLCEHCLDNVLTMKLVFKRDEADKDFVFEQYLPVESVKT